ncbi:MAG: Nif3-like dinuclear metal center hexameric protein [Myxococcales bacterium]|nr:Nif3-like dinuclear metal center hexameric protein [Myxococcales bacterium]
MRIGDLVRTLDGIAPVRLAGDWDNVGLLLEGDRDVRKVLVTIDMTPAVLEEAIEADVDAVLAYHPTIFGGLKRLTSRVAHGPELLALARRGVHLYSPHTALDAVQGGINDWLLEAFAGVAGAHPIEPDAQDPTAGVGRFASIDAVRGTKVLRAIKEHLGLEHLRVAGDLDREVHTVGVCPGAGTSVFRKLRDCDLLLTGEMGHHDVLGWVARGAVVVLTEHSNTERGYLPRYARAVREAAGVDVTVSARDRDPLSIR